VSKIWKTLLSVNHGQPPHPNRNPNPNRRRHPAPSSPFLLLTLLVTALIPLPSPALEPSPDAHRHWAYQPPKPTQPPAVTNTAWLRNDLDRFILARLEAQGRSPAPPADPRTFLRRIHADLTGLPPSFAEVQRFTSEALPDGTPGTSLDPSAVARLTQRLLDSPHYGERWGRHWLDVARYSDTKGYVYGREERFFVHAPTYRDWVVQAFNSDMPYDRFLLLQIAADQLVTPNSPDLAAMGFLTGGRRFLGVTHDIIDDRIDVVTRGALGLTVQCARCHDHKYDPIPIRDYYSLYGVFRGSDVQLVPLAHPDDAELAKRQKAFADAYAQQREAANKRLRVRLAEYLTAQLELEKYPEEGFEQILDADDIIPHSVRRWRDYLLTTRNTEHPIFGPWHALAGLNANTFAQAADGALANLRTHSALNPLVAAAFKTPPASMREVAQRYGDVFASAEKNPEQPGAAELHAFLIHPDSPAVVPDTGIVNTEYFFPTSTTEALGKLQGDIDRRLIELGTPTALILSERPTEPDPRVFIRGSPSRLGDPVPRQFLQVLSRKSPTPFKNRSGRLELARAIVDPSNPLTARVMVNRIWQHHFGTGLVPTSSDLGLRAEPPADPELLDWLALRFIQEGWSIKAIQRLIVTSATYQQASLEPPGKSITSPISLPSPFPLRRLDFEQLRDAMLAVSGELDPTLGGKPTPLLDASNRRRTLYALVDRQYLPGTFRTFDFANPDIHVAVRHQTTVPQQALFFLNGPFAASRARALAQRLSLPQSHVATRDSDAAKTHPNNSERLTALYRSVLQRDPTPREIAAAQHFIEAAASEPIPTPEPPPITAWQYGTGEYDPATKRLKSFTPLPHFTGTAWQGSEAWPGGNTGWAQLTAKGGHPGNTLAHACVRRWIAPSNVVVHISGTLQHEPEAGDGVRAFVLSSRHGELKAVSAHHAKVDITLDGVQLDAGDTLDFVVDIGGNLNSDQFLWAPTLNAKPAIWSAQADFTGPKPQPILLTPWEQFAQVLLLSNEFAFVD